MNITFAPRFLLPLLLCVATSPVLAQNSGVIHFQGRIVAPVCNDAVSPDARAALAGGDTTSAMSGMGGCGGLSGAVIARTSVSTGEQHKAERADSASAALSPQADAYTPDTVWTVTYQ